MMKQTYMPFTHRLAVTVVIALLIALFQSL